MLMETKSGITLPAEQQARYDLFDELIDFVLDGQISFDDAMAQFHHDAADLLTDPDYLTP